MGKSQTPKNESHLKGWTFLSLFALFIAAGIVGKRVFDQPDLVVFFHVPGAVCLVIAWHDLSREVRRRYKEELLARRALGKRS